MIIFDHRILIVYLQTIDALTRFLSEVISLSQTHEMFFSLGCRNGRVTTNVFRAAPLRSSLMLTSIDL